MSTLTAPVVAAALDRPLIETRFNRAPFLRERRELSARGLRRGSPEVTDATRLAHLGDTPEAGQLHDLLARTKRPQTVVEFGTSFAESAPYRAAAQRGNGSRLIATEIEPTKVATGGEDLADAGLPTWSSSWKGRCAATPSPTSARWRWNCSSSSRTTPTNPATASTPKTTRSSSRTPSTAEAQSACGWGDGS